MKVDGETNTQKKRKINKNNSDDNGRRERKEGNIRERRREIDRTFCRR